MFNTLKNQVDFLKIATTFAISIVDHKDKKITGPCVYLAYLYALSKVKNIEIGKDECLEIWNLLGKKHDGIAIIDAFNYFPVKGLNVEFCNDPINFKQFIKDTKKGEVIIVSIMEYKDESHHCTAIDPSSRENTFFDAPLHPDKYELKSAFRVKEGLVYEGLEIVRKEKELISQYYNYRNRFYESKYEYVELEVNLFSWRERIINFTLGYFIALFFILKIITQFVMKKFKIIFSLLWALVVAANLQAQTFNNPQFDAGYSGWQCNSQVVTESSLGGYQAINNVAHNDKYSTLCQTLTGLTVDQEYVVSFDAARCDYCGVEPQKTLKSIVKIDGVPRDTVRRNLPFNFINESFTFIATSTVHEISIHRLGRWSQGYCGMAFDNFNIVASSVYPVELTSFTGSKQNNSIVLNWKTATETNNHHWEIMRAGNNMSWTRIGTINGMGTTASATNYSYIDHEPLTGENYYRLWQIDDDGTLTMSSIIVISRDQLQVKVSVSPNPASDVVRVEMDNLNQYTAAIYSSEGKLIRTIENIAFSNILNIDVQGLGSGAYYISLIGRFDVQKRVAVPFTVAR